MLSATCFWIECELLATALAPGLPPCPACHQDGQRLTLWNVKPQYTLKEVALAGHWRCAPLIPALNQFSKFEASLVSSRTASATQGNHVLRKVALVISSRQGESN